MVANYKFKLEVSSGLILNFSMTLKAVSDSGRKPKIIKDYTKYY